MSLSSLRNLMSLVLASGFLALTSCSSPVTQTAADEAQPRATVGLGGNGVNIQPSYYNGGNVDLAYDKLKAFDTSSRIKVIRIEIEPSVAISQVNTCVSQTSAAGYTILATYHKAAVLGSDNAADLSAAGDWWAANYKELKKAAGTKPLVINLMNEWGSHNISALAYAKAYNTAIAKVRGAKDYNGVKYSGPIVIDAPGWGQETTTLINAVKGIGTGGVKINDTNIILSLHVYPGAWNQSAGGHWLNTSDVTALAGAGRPLLVGEFGYGGSSGSCDVTAVTNAVHSLGYSVIGWCWNGDGTGMNMMSPSWETAAWPYPRTSIAKTSYWTTIYNMLW